MTDTQRRKEMQRLQKALDQRAGDHAKETTRQTADMRGRREQPSALSPEACGDELLAPPASPALPRRDRYPDAKALLQLGTPAFAGSSRQGCDQDGLTGD